MPRKQKKYHYIYKTTCVVTKKYYYGMHSTNELNDGYVGSGKRLWYSINKYGKENHTIEILEYYEDRRSLKNRESELVNEDILKDPMCMNLKLGGEGGFVNEEHKIKYILAGSKAGVASIKEKHKDPEYKKQWGEKRKTLWKDPKYREKVLKRSGFKEKKHTYETKLKMSKADRTGSKNSQFGTCWIYNLELKESKKIKKEKLNTFIDSGWIKGRKIKF